MKDESYLVRSSIPFVLIGATRVKPEGHGDVLIKNPDRVLVRGGDAEIGLVGFVREKEVSYDVNTDPSYRSLFARKKFWLVRSEGQPPSFSARDQRYSTYVLAWKGAAWPSSEIEEQFNKSLPDILIAIDEDSLPQTEWALARVIFLIQTNEARRLREKDFVVRSVILCVLVTLLGLSLWLALR